MKKYLFILVLPAIVGILVGIVVLTINPKAGQHVGDVLYSKGVNVDSYAYAVAKAAPSVVNIYVTSPDTEYAGENKKEEGGSSAITNSASGVIMRSDGYIVTNYHVVPSSKDPDQAVWAMLRTGELYQPPFLLNMTNRTLEKNGERVKLTQLEYSIVKLFMENRGKALAREEILDAVWGKGYFGELKIVDVNVRRLRIKIEDDAQEPKYISTVWGFGYKWTV